MQFLETKKQLNHHGVLLMLQTAVQHAEEMGQPQCIVIVDASGQIQGEIVMSGAKFLSRKSALAKALTAASIGNETTIIPDQIRPLIAAATDGNVTGLPGGLPIIFNGETIGGIGVGSGTGEQDIAVGKAALSAVGADPV